MGLSLGSVTLAPGFWLSWQWSGNGVVLGLNMNNKNKRRKP